MPPRTPRRACWLLALLAAAAGAAAETDGFPFAASDWNMARMRKGIGGSMNVLTVSFTLTNQTQSRLSLIRPLLELKGVFGNDAGTIRGDELRALEAGEAGKLSLMRDLVPAFNTYFLRIQYRAGNERKEALFLGTSPFDAPVPVPEKPTARRIQLLPMGYDLTSDPRTRQGLLTVRVRNFGGLPARRPTVCLRVYNRSRQLAGQLEAPLRDPKTPRDALETVAAGEEKTYSLQLVNVPPYDAYDIFVRHEPPRPDEVLGGESFKGTNDVEIVLDAVKFEPGRLTANARARNGTTEKIGELEMTFRLLKHTAKKDAQGRELLEVEGKVVGSTHVKTGLSLAPGEEAAFSFVYDKPPAEFDDYGYELAYATGEQPAAPTAGEPAQPPLKVQAQLLSGKKHADGSAELELLLACEGGGKKVDGVATLRFLDAQGAEVAVRKLPFSVPGNQQKKMPLFFENVGDFANCQVDLELAGNHP